MPDYPKKLIEVALPLAEINASSAREKSIRHGHPSKLHLWWARRPLAAARAVIFSQLVDDPSGYVEELRADAQAVKSAERELKIRSKPWQKKKTEYDKAKAAGMQIADPGEEPKLTAILVEQERERLFKIIRELVIWENSNNESILEPAREEIRKSWRRTCRREGKPEDTPLPPFLDPFAGGGAIPLEAQRLGLEAHASDLNPVAVLINKAMIEIPPKFANQPPVNPEWQAKSNEEKAATTWTGAQGLAEDVRYYGQLMRDEAFKRIGHLYPPYKLTQELIDSRPDLKKAGYKAGDELTVIAWLWARTVPSPNPALNGKHVPLLSSFWLSKKKSKEAYLEPVIENGNYRFEVRVGKPSELDEINAGTKTGRGNFKCLLSGIPINASYNREQGQAGNLDAKLMAVVCEGKAERIYLNPSLEQEDVASESFPSLRPEQEFFQEALGFRIGNYGLTKWGDLFTNRQLVALNTFCDLAAEAREKALADAKATQQLPDDKRHLDQHGTGPAAYADAVTVYLAFVIDRLAMTGNSLVRWNSTGQKAQHCFGRQTLSMLWDYAEPNFFGSATGSLSAAYLHTADPLSLLGNDRLVSGTVKQANASSRYIDEGTIISTDPPYYDNIGYADLSDFFYVWLRKTLQPANLSFFETMAVPKNEELVATPARHGGKEKAYTFFMEGMKSFAIRVAKCSDPIPSTIYYAFKQSETFEEGVVSQGWASFLEAFVTSGITIAGTWPVRTELSNRMRGQNANALASSVVLVCRKRPEEAPMATRKEFAQALQRELPASLESLQQVNIAPVDLPQSSIGPGMAIFSRYNKILEADGSTMRVRTALQLINQSVDDYFSEQEAQMDDWTRFAVTWFSQFGFESGPAGDAINIGTAKNVTIESVTEAGIIESGGGKVRILKTDELSDDWDPGEDNRLTVWEIVHHLARRLENDGVDGAATILKQVGGLAEDARALCYRLYTICEQNKWADEASAYNNLITEWPTLTDRARTLETDSTPTQQDLLEV